MAEKIIIDHDSIWDDTLLVKAYDNSVKLAREELARRIASATNKKPAEKAQCGTGDEAASILPGPHSNSPETTLTDNESLKYKVGDYVRCTYEDGVDYEAIILSIDENDVCTLRYVGYNNMQQAPMEDLVPSWGYEYRNQQEIDAKHAESDNIAEGEMATDVGQNAVKAHAKKTSKATKTPMNKSKLYELSDYAVPPPPPPPMPPMLNDDGTYKSEDAEHISAMLMSWYMSGYYTGVYRGVQIGKASNKNKK